MIVMDEEKMNHWSEKLGVKIQATTLKASNKRKKDVKKVTIRGIERNAKNIYEAYGKLLALDESELQIPIAIPNTYHIPPDYH